MTDKFEIDSDGTERFKGNAIIRYVIDMNISGKVADMNTIWIAHQNGLGTRKELKELYKLMGYSKCGFCEVFEEDWDKYYPDDDEED